MLKTRTSAILSLALVFVSGALLGALGFRAYNTSTANSQRQVSPAEWRQRNLAEMHTRLKLNDQQYAKLVKIFDSFDDEFRQVVEKRRQEDQASPGSMLDKTKRAIADQRAKIGLTEQQVAGVNQVIDQVDEDFRQLIAKRRAESAALQNSLIEKINAILQPDQRELYKEYRDERQKMRERRLRDDGNHGPGGPGGPPMGPPPGKR